MKICGGLLKYHKLDGDDDKLALESFQERHRQIFSFPLRGSCNLFIYVKVTCQLNLYSRETTSEKEMTEKSLRKARRW